MLVVIILIVIFTVSPTNTNIAELPLFTAQVYITINYI